MQGCDHKGWSPSPGANAVPHALTIRDLTTENTAWVSAHQFSECETTQGDAEDSAGKETAGLQILPCSVSYHFHHDAFALNLQHVLSALLSFQYSFSEGQQQGLC